MPGGDIVPPGARCTTRAVTIGVLSARCGRGCPARYGRAGWYSYHVFKIGGQRGAELPGPNGSFVPAIASS
jgi:hypothetical protein